MIVRNERSCIAKALNSVSDADEIIVCDTGSTDDTVEISRNSGAKVFTDYQWNDNFAEARNHSLDKCTGDWVLIIDADEHIEPGGIRKIRELLQSGINGHNTVYFQTVSEGGSHVHNSNMCYLCAELAGTLTIPDTVTSIGTNAFGGCTLLTSVSIGTGVTVIPASCFDGDTSLTGTLAIPSGITSIGNYAFRNNAWTRVDSFPSTAPTIGTSPFDNDAMALHIPTGGGTGYGVAPWTTAAIFTQPPVADL